MPELGQRGYEVEWCHDLPTLEDGFADMDAAKYFSKVLPTREKAMAFARNVFPHDQFGAVTITPVEFTDPYGDNFRHTFRWEPCGDAEYYEGEAAECRQKGER